MTRRVIGKWIPIAIATGIGLLTLAGYVFPGTVLSAYRDQLIEWAIIIAAFALILGVFNILRVHSQRIVNSDEGWPYSLILVVTALLAWIPPLLEGPSGPMTQVMLNYAISPLGGAMAALVVFSLTLAAVRLLRYRRHPSSALFIVVVSLSLLGTTPLVGFEWLGEIREWILNVPGMAGFRGLLLGVALGTLITGLRIILGRDRPHSEF
jgi:hypothetical protein